MQRVLISFRLSFSLWCSSAFLLSSRFDRDLQLHCQIRHGCVIDFEERRKSCWLNVERWVVHGRIDLCEGKASQLVAVSVAIPFFRSLRFLPERIVDVMPQYSCYMTPILNVDDLSERFRMALAIRTSDLLLTISPDRFMSPKVGDLCENDHCEGTLFVHFLVSIISYDTPFLLHIKHGILASHAEMLCESCASAIRRVEDKPKNVDGITIPGRIATLLDDTECIAFACICTYFHSSLDSWHLVDVFKNRGNFACICFANATGKFKRGATRKWATRDHESQFAHLCMVLLFPPFWRMPLESTLSYHSIKIDALRTSIQPQKNRN